MAFKKPNYTQVPNEVFDEWMSRLTGAEFKILLIIFRNTRGYQKEEAEISTSDLCMRAGLSNRCVIDSLKSLVSHDLITAKGESTFEKSYRIKYETYEESSQALMKKIHKTYEENSQVDSESSIRNININKTIKKDETKYFTFNTIKIKESKYQTLLQDYGKEIVTEYIENADDYLSQIGAQKAAKYKDHGAMISNWIRRAGIKKRVANIDERERLQREGLKKLSEERARNAS